MRTCQFILTALTTISTFAMAMDGGRDRDLHPEASNRKRVSEGEAIPVQTTQDILNAIKVYEKSIQFHGEMDPYGINPECQDAIRKAEEEKRKLNYSLVEALTAQFKEVLKAPAPVTDADEALARQLELTKPNSVQVVNVREEPQTVNSIDEAIRLLKEWDPNGEDRDIQRQLSSLRARKRSWFESSVPNPAPVADDRDEALARQLSEEFEKQRAIQVVNVQEEPQTVNSIDEAIRLLKEWDPNGEDRDMQRQLSSLKAQKRSLLESPLASPAPLTSAHEALARQLNEELANFQKDVISPAAQIAEQNREYEETLRQNQRKTRVQELTTQNEQIEKEIQKLQGQVDEASALFERNNKGLIDEVNRLKQALERDQARATLYQGYNTLNATPSRAIQLSQLEADLNAKKEQFTKTQQEILASLETLNGKKEIVQRELQNIQ